MFEDARLAGGTPPADCTIWIDDHAVAARVGEPLAAAMLRAGSVPFRHSAVSGEARAPLCMMGVCFECLVELDGMPNTQSCMIPVRDGMRVIRQHGARRIGGGHE